MRSKTERAMIDGVALFAGISAAAATAAERPHLVLILADDLIHVHDLAATSAGVLERLAALLNKCPAKPPPDTDR